jgi:hypothetical protein
MLSGGAIKPPQPIHLLGMSDNYMDDVAVAGQPQVSGMDSANPSILGLMGIKVGGTQHHHHRGEAKTWYWEVPPREELEDSCVANNIKAVRERIHQ